MWVDRLLRYVRSPSTRMAAFAALLSYLSYAYAHGSWANPALIGVSVFVGLLSDLRSVMAPKGGIGIFFGTFNPFHNTHLDLIRRALDERGLDRIIIHPTLVPRLHAEAFRKGELRVGRLENGFQIYETTAK